MSTQELVTSIVAEQEESADQFVNILQQKIEDAIEVKRIELASQMFEASKKCPECGKADCECDDEDYEDEEDDEEEMKEEVEQIDELSRKTLLSYLGKTSKQTETNRKAALKYLQKGGDPENMFKAKSKLNKATKRYIGATAAVDKLAGTAKVVAKEEVEQIDEMAPPGAKYERMVKHIKKGYSKGGLTKNEKSIAYATAWKAKNKEMSEAAMSDAQQMAALGMKGADKAKTMTALAAYRKHGDINKLSAGHRSLIAGYMEKTGGLAAVSRGTAAQALKKERMQEE